MGKRLFAAFALGGLALLLGFGARSAPPKPAAAPDRPVAPATVKIAASRVVAVTIYPNSALVTREVDVADGAGNLELTVTPLPPNTINSSLYTEGTDGIRVLTTRFRSRAVQEDTREDVRKLQDELKQLELAREKIEAEMKAVTENAQNLTKMESFMTITTVQSAEKGALNSDSAIALSKYVRETRLETAKDLVGLKQQVQANQEKAEFAQRKLAELASGTVRTERDAVIVVEKTNAAAGKVRLNYLVDAASWHPQYKVRAGKTPKEAVQLEYLASVMQHTGEDWSNVKLALSTVEPALNAAPPDLQSLQVTAVPKANAPSLARQTDTMDLEEQVKGLRNKAQQSLNQKKQASGIGLLNTAAALDQSWELFNPDAAIKRGCALAPREGPTVTYHLASKLTVPSRNDEQVLEVARLDFQPEYYYKAVPILSTQVYRLADLTNKSAHVLLPGEATMYIGTDFVGQMSLPLVAVGEQFTAGFGVDPQLQVQRQMIDKSRTTQGANQALRFEYRILVSNFKTEPVKLQVWDRLPRSETEAVGVSLLKASPDLSKDAMYQREQRPNNLLRWDVTVDANTTNEKALPINYEFKLELDRQMAISNFQTAGVLATTANPAPNPAPNPSGHPAMTLTAADQEKVNTAMAKLTPEDRKLAQAQFFCAIDQDSPLGTMGPIFKEMVKGQPVFLCCKGCVAECRAHPDETLAQVQKLMARIAPKK